MASLAIDTLWYSDKASLDIGKTDTLGVVSMRFDSYDASIRDLAWDGANIWAINTDGVIKKFNPKTGDLLDEYEGLIGGGWGLTFDGAYMWASNPKDDRLYQIYFPGLADASPPPAPALASQTHASPQTWYANDSPTFTWTEPDDPSGIDGYSFLADRAPQTNPDTSSEGVTRSKSYLDLPDGIWYFHCRARDGSGNWGPAGHFPFRIDTTAPAAPLHIAVVPSGWSKADQFTVTWTNPSDISGIAGVLYKKGTPPVRNDDGSPVDTADISEWYFSLGTEGQQNFYLWLKDGAGNRDYTHRSMVTMQYDGSGPYEGSISINSGDMYTLSPVVNLGSLGAVDYLSGFGPGSLMRFSNNGTIWCPPEPYAASRSDWDLSLYGGTADAGIKIVHAQYQDLAGNWSLAFSDSIIWAGPPSITTEVLPEGIVGFAYQETLAASGGIPPFTWHVISGSLPHNVVLDSEGVMHGVPDRSGVSLFTVEVVDSSLNTDTQPLAVKVSAGSRRGDVDNNTVLNLFDALLAIRYILDRVELTGAQLWAADATADGLIDISDVIAIVNLILGRPPGAPRTMAPAKAVISLLESASLAGGADRWIVSLENPTPVSGLQLEFALPDAYRLSSQPQLSQEWLEHSLVFAESDGRLRAVVYSTTGHVLPPYCGSIVSFELTPEKGSQGDGEIRLGELLAADVDGRLLPVETRISRAQSGPSSTNLAFNYPNPFNASTTISYTIPVQSTKSKADGGDGTLNFEPYTSCVTLKIYNILGQEMQTLVDALQEPGQHSVSWDGRNDQGQSLPSGVYFCRIEGSLMTQTLQLVLMR